MLQASLYLGFFVWLDRFYNKSSINCASTFPKATLLFMYSIKGMHVRGHIKPTDRPVVLRINQIIFVQIGATIFVVHKVKTELAF